MRPEIPLAPTVRLRFINTLRGRAIELTDDLHTFTVYATGDREFRGKKGLVAPWLADEVCRVQANFESYWNRSKEVTGSRKISGHELFFLTKTASHS